MSDIYAAPQAELREATPSGSSGSLERGIAGDYDYTIGGVLREAWEKTKGAKTPILLCVLIAALISGAIALVPVALIARQGEEAAASLSFQLGQQIVMSLVGAPLTAGLYLIAVRRSVGAPIRAGMIFDALPRIWPLFLAQILVSLLTFVGILLLVVPGIYLAVGYTLVLPLVAEKGLGPWAAMEASRKAIGRRWFKLFGLGLLLALINGLAILTLGIALIWTVPMSLIALGIVYREMFGVEPGTAAGAPAMHG